MARLEADLVKQIKSRLSSGSLSGSIIWWMRIQVGSFKVDGRYIKTPLEMRGTPDFIAVVRNKQGNITVLFIEAKSDTGTLREEQLHFAQKYSKEKDMRVITVRDINYLNTILNEIEYDRLQELPDIL